MPLQPIKECLQAFRGLCRAPQFTIAAVAVIALGAGGPVSVLYLFSPPSAAVRDPKSIYELRRFSTNGSPFGFPVVAFSLLRQKINSASDLIAETPAGFMTDSTPEPVAISFVSANYFHALDIGPLAGRLLRDDDEQAGKPFACVASDLLWQRRFGTQVFQPGRSITINGHSVAVVGLAPRDFSGLSGVRTDLWCLLRAHTALVTGSWLISGWSSSAVHLYVRLRPGVSRDTPALEWRAAYQDLKLLAPEYFSSSETADIQPAIASRDSSRALSRFLLIVSCLLLACAGSSLASLHAARVLSRRREIEIRRALGAQERHILPQLLLENAWLAIFGAIGAVLAGRLALAALRILQKEVPNAPLKTDIGIIAAAFVLAFTASFVFGFLPVLKQLRTGYKPVRRRRILLGFQSGVSCFFVIMGALLTQSARNRLTHNVHFPINEILQVTPAPARHPFYNLPGGVARLRIDQIRSRISMIPGIQAHTLSRVHLGGGAGFRWSQELRRFVWLNRVDPSYFAFMQCRLVRGRLFGPHEANKVVVSESAARELWPRLDPIGKEFAVPDRNESIGFTVVGVVSDTGESHLTAARPRLSGEVFAPLSDADISRASILVRTDSMNVNRVASALRTAALFPETDPEVLPLAVLIARLYPIASRQMIVLDYLGTAGAFLAAVGLSGFLWYSMVARRRDLAIRLALGARQRDILAGFLSQYAVPVLIGVGIALFFAANCALFASSVLVGVSPFDPLAYAGGLLAALAPLTCAGIVATLSARRILVAEVMKRD